MCVLDILSYLVLAVPRNYDPSLHPFEAPREYSQALNAVKLERVFAKPFLGALEGHRDGVHCLCKHPSALSQVLSGSCDGEVSIYHTIIDMRVCATDLCFCGEIEILNILM